MISLIRHDSLKKLFEYAERTKGADRLISIALEPQVSSPRDWWGGVGMVLGSRSCTDLSAALGAPAAESEHLLEPQLRALVDEVTNLRGGGATASGGAVPGGAVPGGAGGAQGGVLLGGAHVDASAGTAGFSGAVLGASAVLGGELPTTTGLPLSMHAHAMAGVSAGEMTYGGAPFSSAPSSSAAPAAAAAAPPLPLPKRHHEHLGLPEHAIEHATESARRAHDGAERSPLPSYRSEGIQIRDAEGIHSPLPSYRSSTISSTAAHLPSTSQPVGVNVHQAVGVNVHQATSQQTTARHASSPAGGASDTDSSSTAGAAMSPVGGGGGAARPSAQSAASASAAAPSSAAPQSGAAPLGSPAAERTMAQKVARVKEELSLDPSLPVAKAVAEANAVMGIEGQGSLARQVDYLLTELGVL